VHVRSIEFLGIKTKPGDRSASDLFSSWSPPTKNGAEAATWAKLNHHWLTATKHVTHFTQLRTKQDNGTQVQDNGTQVSVPVEETDLEAIANDVLALWDLFAEETAKADPMASLRVPKRGSFKLWNADGTLQKH
jgi:hypothetical protein